jgi:hypothetical protein
MLDDAANIARAKRYEITRDQPRKAVTDAKNFPSSIQPRARNSPDGRIHASGVTAARQYRDTFHFNRLSQRLPAYFPSYESE